ncbi:hypothetical protein EV193_114132 [Herbihabitans rhizosphaerae]|uniref:Uncharacterized protein n=1 Tax=Herbihabitans rhizosphaerae TaxID=1872711 RepID=A0A4Q7KD23_9PSEU|nr:hypothetical protein [Herbihabitans rhizosphaerae]RZS31439.1 hypothetical protein EV193_114132 [Herbihabitans rhizosphaerae]
MLRWLAEWWGGVELWITQLWFPFQFLLVMGVLLPVCLTVAWALDRIVDFLSARFGPSRGQRVTRSEEPEQADQVASS